MAKRKVKKEDGLILGTSSLFDFGQDENKAPEKRDYLTVGEFLEHLNDLLRSQRTFVAGEVTEFRAHDKWISFSLKDKEDNSILKCFTSVWTYRKTGVLLEDGMQIKIGGYPRIYKLAGTFSFNVETIEPLGEGSLKKAYQLLLKKLEIEGLFARKRALPKFIKNIGVISSKDGVVIHDFLKNLKPLGFKINFFNSRVEGADAVPGITDGIKWLNKNILELDVIVLMRGGGSLESMQAFNNEQVCREVFASKVPVLCGIGHEVDVPIACLVADSYVSTPTATAYAINQSWDDLILGLPMLERQIFSSFNYLLRDTLSAVPSIERSIISQFGFLLSGTRSRVSTLSGKIFSGFRQVFFKFNLLSEKITKNAMWRIGENISDIRSSIQKYERILTVADPERNLRLGYSIVFDPGGKVIKNVKELKKGEIIKTKMSGGEVESEVKSIKI